MASRLKFLLFQVVWVVAAALSLLAGICLLTPIRSFSKGTPQSVSSFLKAVAGNPDLLRMTDPIMKLMNFTTIVVIVVAFYRVIW